MKRNGVFIYSKAIELLVPRSASFPPSRVGFPPIINYVLSENSIDVSICLRSIEESLGRHDGENSFSNL